MSDDNPFVVFQDISGKMFGGILIKQTRRKTKIMVNETDVVDIENRFLVPIADIIKELSRAMMEHSVHYQRWRFDEVITIKYPNLSRMKDKIWKEFFASQSEDEND